MISLHSINISFALCHVNLVEISNLIKNDPLAVVTSTGVPKDCQHLPLLKRLCSNPLLLNAEKNFQPALLQNASINN